MGNLCGCCKDSNEYNDIEEQPPPEVKRQQAAEAAERRMQTNSNRGIQDPDKVRRMQERSEARDRMEEEAAKAGGGNPALRWQAN